MHDEGVDRREFMKGAAVGAVGLGLGGTRLFAQEQGKLRTRVLGRTKIKSSVIVFGGVQIRPDSVRLLQVARERGVNTFDVAWGYGRGQAELGIGALLDATKQREKLHIITKASGYWPRGGSGKAVYADLEQQVSASLKRMKTEYVDVFMWPHGASSTSFLNAHAMRDAMRKLKKQGLVRHFGVSSHANYAKVCEAAVEDGFYDVVLSVLNVCTQNADKAEPVQGRRNARLPEDTRALLKLAKKKNVGVLAMKCANDRFLSPNTNQLLSGEFKQQAGWSRHQKLYAYCLKQEGVSAAVVGIGSTRHLEQALAIAAV